MNSIWMISTLHETDNNRPRKFNLLYLKESSTLLRRVNHNHCQSVILCDIVSVSGRRSAPIAISIQAILKVTELLPLEYDYNISIRNHKTTTLLSMT